MKCNEACQDDIMTLASGIAGSLTLLTMVVSLIQIGKHLIHYTNPFFQNKIITIIFMAPFYSLTSFFTIAFQDTKGYFALVRDIYEAVLIYAFFNLLALYLAYDPMNKDVDYDRIYEILATKGVKQHIWPVDLLFRPILLISKIRAKWFFRQSRLYILQYLAIKPTMTLILVIVYVFIEKSAFALLIKLVVLVSVCFSVYYLVLFYQLLNQELAFARPLLKFISVKGVLFFTFWQDFVIELFKPQIISQFTGLTSDDEKFIIEVCENMLVCFEMVLLAALTTVAFSHNDFKAAERYAFLKSNGVGALTKKFVNNVLADTFVTAIEDLKELKEPLKDPFKSYGDGQIEQSDMMTITLKQKAGLIGEDIFKQFKVNIIERPNVIPDFIEISKRRHGDSEEDRLL